MVHDVLSQDPALSQRHDDATARSAHATPHFERSRPASPTTALATPAPSQAPTSNEAQRSTVTITTTAPTPPRPAAQLDPSKQPDRKRQRSPSRDSRRPRPTPLSSKSSSAVPTLSAGEVTPSVSSSPTRATLSRKTSWLPLKAKTMAASQGVNPADLLRRMVQQR